MCNVIKLVCCPGLEEQSNDVAQLGFNIVICTNTEPLQISGNDKCQIIESDFAPNVRWGWVLMKM